MDAWQATKEFSKARLRRRAQSNILRRPHGPPRPGMRSPWAMHKQQLSQTEVAEAKDALFLIREEIAVMKKLNHPNLVQLIEVLDDPEEDSLWMVLEMCKKGVVMKVGLDDHADPYPEEKCRHWFRDLILGVEYRTSMLQGAKVCPGADLVDSPCSRCYTPRYQTRQPAPDDG